MSQDEGVADEDVSKPEVKTLSKVGSGTIASAVFRVCFAFSFRSILSSSSANSRSHATNSILLSSVIGFSSFEDAPAASAPVEGVGVIARAHWDEDTGAFFPAVGTY